MGRAAEQRIPAGPSRAVLLTVLVGFDDPRRTPPELPPQDPGEEQELEAPLLADELFIEVSSQPPSFPLAVTPLSGVLK